MQRNWKTSHVPKSSVLAMFAYSRSPIPQIATLVSAMRWMYSYQWSFNECLGPNVFLKTAFYSS